MKRQTTKSANTLEASTTTNASPPKKGATISPAGFAVVVLLGSVAVIWHLLDPTSTFQRYFAQYSLGLFFTVSGLFHFQPSLVPFYVLLMPSFFPLKKELIYLSGVIELIFGLLMFSPSPLWVNVGAWGVLATLIAVYPANINHALSKEVQRKTKLNATFAYIRLPIQFIFFAWAYVNTTMTLEQTYQAVLLLIQK